MSDNISTTDTVISALVSAFLSLNWEIKRRPAEDRTDLVVSSPSGHLFTIELKTGEGSAHFASLAQAERTAQQIADDERQDVTPVFVTTQDVTPVIASVADKVGVEVVDLSTMQSDAEASLEELTTSAVRELERREKDTPRVHPRVDPAQPDI